MPTDCSKFGVSIEKLEKNQWSFCIGLSHWVDETYLFINLFRWSISVGKLQKSEESYEDYTKEE